MPIEQPTPPRTQDRTSRTQPAVVLIQSKNTARSGHDASADLGRHSVEPPLLGSAVPAWRALLRATR